MRLALVSRYGRLVLPVALATVLSACSGQMVPPEDIDGDSQVSSIRPVNVSNDSAYAAPVNPVEEAAESADALNRPNLAGSETPSLPKIDEQPAADQAAMADQSVADQPVETVSVAPEGGVNIDNELGVAPTSLAREEANTIAEGNTAEPTVDGIGTDAPVEIGTGIKPGSQLDIDASATADELTLPSRRVDTEKETKVAFMPRFSDPLQVPESYGGLTAGDRACRTELKKLGVSFRELSPISDGPACSIDHPIKVTGFSGNIELKPAATLNCKLTLAFAKWVKYELVPSARYRYFSGIKTIRQMSSYSCRKMNSISENPWSEHARGNAIDVGTFTLKSGKEIDVEKKGFFAFREKGLLKAVRTDSCKYFDTVLGPGDPHHKDHYHFDLRSRKSGRHYCSQ
jgi:hypothetical protein